MVDEVFEQAWDRTGDVAVILIDHDGVVRSWSTGATGLFGFAPEEAIGREVAELIVPEPMRDRHRAGVRALAEVGPSPHMGGTFTRPAVDSSGRQFPVQLTLLTVPMGASTWTAGVARPVTEAVGGEPVPPSEVLTAVFERAPEAITVLDAAGRQVTVNARGAAMFGYGEAGRYPGDGRHLVHPDDQQRVAEYGVGIRAGEIPFHTPIRYRVLAGDGRWNWLEMLMADLTDVPGVEGFVAFSRDVTEDEERRFQLDAARRLAEETGDELRQLAESRLTFAASVSHELRTPLTSISSAIEMLGSHQPVDPADADTYLAIIDRNTRRLTRLVEDLLMFSRAEVGLLRLYPEPIDHLEVLHEAVEALRPRAEARSVRIHTDARPGPVLHHDPERILQVAQNLLDNAIKHADASSTVVVRSDVEDDRWTMSFENEGDPIDPIDIDGIFEPFFRSSRQQSTVDGTGLGLTLVAQIVGLAGGSLECDATMSTGARFVVTLPTTQPVPERSERAG